MAKSTDRIFILASPAYRFFLVKLAERLHRLNGSEIHFYCSFPKDLEFFGDATRGFATTKEASVLHSALRESPAPWRESVAEATANEAWMGLTYNELAVSDRHLGRAFALGGTGHPRSRQSATSDLHGLIHSYNRGIQFWRSEIEARKPTLMLMGGKIPAAVARASGIAYRTVATSRYLGYHYWAHNDLFESPEIVEAYRRQTADAGPRLGMDRPYDEHMLPRQHYLDRMGLFGLVRELSFLTARRPYWHIRGYPKARSYYFLEELRYACRKWRDGRRLTRGCPKLSDLKDKRFVFYPLQTEPEQSLQGLSPEYFFQMETIAALSRDLPAGVLLAVKETFWSLGRRPANFYEQIREFKNVVLLDTLELGLDVVRAAEATATITSSAGFEAAVMGKPVISFGLHNIYDCLPHVTRVERMADLKHCLRRALDETDAGEARREGARFLNGLVEVSFGMDGYHVYDPEKIEDSSVADAHGRLVAGLAHAPSPASSR